MKNYFLLAVFLVAGLKQPQSLYSAESKDSVPLAPVADRSQHFAAVNKYLDLGGELYSYVDVDGDMQLFATQLRRFADGLAESQPVAGAILQQDFGKIFEDLGLTDIKAIGLSSVRDSYAGYRNRVFFYTPGGRHGLLAVLGGSAAPYVHTGLAPADTDFFSEGEFDLPAVYKTIRAVVVRVAGEMSGAMMDNQLKKAGAEAGVTAFDVIQSLKGRGVMIMRFDGEKNLPLPTPQPLNIPAFSLLLRIDGVGATLDKTLSGMPFFAVKQEGALKTFTLQMPMPVEGLQPVLAIEKGALYLATSPAFLQECVSQKEGLAKSKEFQLALEQVGREGNGLAYVSPKFFARLKQLPAINPEVAPDVKRVLSMVVDNIPEVSRPLVTGRSNLPDGILVRSSANRTLKPVLAAMAVYNPVTIGMMAAMGIPAFNKVRQDSQEKTIQNNLRQFGAAAQQFMLENAKSEAKYDDVVGPDKLVRELTPVAGEDYTGLVLKEGDTSISVTTAAGKEVKVDL